MRLRRLRPFSVGRVVQSSGRPGTGASVKLCLEAFPIRLPGRVVWLHHERLAMKRLRSPVINPADSIRPTNLTLRGAVCALLLALSGCASEGEPEGPTTPTDTT